jgi:hypothetical protein
MFNLIFSIHFWTISIGANYFISWSMILYNNTISMQYISILSTYLLSNLIYPDNSVLIVILGMIFAHSPSKYMLTSNSIPQKLFQRNHCKIVSPASYPAIHQQFW